MIFIILIIIEIILLFIFYFIPNNITMVIPFTLMFIWILFVDISLLTIVILFTVTTITCYIAFARMKILETHNSENKDSATNFEKDLDELFGDI